MKLRELLAGLSARMSGGSEADIQGISHDSREIREGYLFFALAGAKTDGHRHIKDALKNGAAAIVSELEAPPPPISIPIPWVHTGDIVETMGRLSDRFYGHPSENLCVIGVTGTNGKTTTTYFLESLFKAAGHAAAVAGTINYRLRGKPLEEAVNTTPVAPHIQRLLAAFRDGGATHVAMEVSSHALSLRRVDEIDFDAAVFTNLRRDHLDFHGNREEYFKAKQRLFELLGKIASSKRTRVAAINADDPCAEALKRISTTSRVVTFGLGAAMLRAEALELSLSGTRFDLLFEGGRWPAEIRLVGQHNVMNALAAAAAVLGLGFKPAHVLEGLRSLECVPGRLEAVRASDKQDFHVFVDYAHTDSALETVLGYLKELPHRRLITVFGCGGDRDKTKRGPMGLAACEASDEVLITSDNPRCESPQDIIADIEKGLKSAGRRNYKVEVDRRRAIEGALSQAQTGDIILIAGKGHENYQILKDKTVPFDDRQIAREALKHKWTLI